jgi:hypothetical protein
VKAERHALAEGQQGVRSDVDSIGLSLQCRRNPCRAVPFELSTTCTERLPSVIQFKVSSFCNFGNCVEVGTAPDGSVVLRDSKDADRSVSLVFTGEEWNAFVKGVKAGEFDSR